MAKRELTDEQKIEVERYGHTKGNFTKIISNHMRQLWMICYGRKQALIESRVPCRDGSRKKWKEKCADCGDEYYVGEKYYKITKKGVPSKKATKCLVVHHIDGVPDPLHPDFMKYLYCEQYDNPHDGYAVLCQDCHDKVHNKGEEEA